MMISARKALLWTVLQTATLLAAHVGVAKLVAVSHGPEGVAMLGQVQAVLAVFYGLTGIQAFSKAVVKGCAGNPGDASMDSRLVSSGMAVLLPLWLVVGAGMALLVWTLGGAALGFPAHQHLILWIGLLGAGAALQQLLVAWLTGRGRYPAVSILNTVQALVGLGVVLAATLLPSFSLAMVGMLTAQALVGMGLCAYFFWRGEGRFELAWRDLGQLFRYGAGIWPSAVLAGLMMLALRSAISNSLGLERLGIWQALVRFSDGYFLVLAQLGHSYFFVRFVRAAGDHRHLRKEVLACLGLGAACLGGIAAIVLLEGETILGLLYSPEFRPGAGYLPMMLVNDGLKYISMAFSVLMLAVGNLRIYLLQDLVFNGVLLAGVGFSAFANLAQVWLLMISAQLAILATMAPSVLRSLSRP